MRVFRNVFIALVILMVVVTFAIKFIVLPNVATMATNEIVSSFAAAAGLTEAQKDYLNTNIDQDDVDTVETIIENHMFDSEIISQAATAVQKGDYNTLQTMADENLTTEEQEQLTALYEKYKDLVTEEDWPEY